MKNQTDWILVTLILLIMVYVSSSCSPYGKGCMSPGALDGPGAWRTKFNK